jgi:ZIP family zinc transporter
MTAAPLTVFLAALATAFATGLGAVPFIFLRRISPVAVASANAIAGGLMLGASFGIVAEGTRYGAWQTLAGALLGVLFIVGTQRLIGDRELSFGSVRGADARQMVLIVLVMTVHSFAEGVAVGVSFGGGAALALMITLAISVHNVPEGLAISAVLRPRGVGILACAGWSIFSSLPQPLMAVPAFLFVETFRKALPYGLGFAAGAMVFMVLEELLPEAYDRAPRPLVALQVSLTLVGMVLFQQFL